MWFESEAPAPHFGASRGTHRLDLSTDPPNLDGVKTLARGVADDEKLGDASDYDHVMRCSPYYRERALDPAFALVDVEAPGQNSRSA